jgi:hypothetical protein
LLGWRFIARLVTDSHIGSLQPLFESADSIPRFSHISKDVRRRIHAELGLLLHEQRKPFAMLREEFKLFSDSSFLVKRHAASRRKH